MMRFAVPYLLYSAAALICIFLQSAVFSYLEIFNAKPDLLLLLVVMSALKTDWKNGVAVGLLVGFWIDLMNAAYFGSNMVVYAVVGAAFGALGMRFPHRTYEGYFFTAVAATLLSGILMLAVLSMLGLPLAPGNSIGGIILPMTFYNALLTFFALPLVWLHRRNGKRRKIRCIDLMGAGVVRVRGNEPVDIESRRRRKKGSHREKRGMNVPFGGGRSKNNSGSRGSSGLFGGKNRQSGGTRRENENTRRENRGSSPRNDRERPSGHDPKRDSRGNSSDRRPKSRPQRRPQKHSGRRSK